MSTLSRTITADVAAERLPKDPARSEARGLLALLNNGETADSIRRLIVCGRTDQASQNYRRQVLISFEVGLWQRGGKKPLSPVLRATILALAQKGLSDRAIHQRVPVGIDAIAALAGEIRLEANILERLLANKTTEQVARDLHISISPVRRISRKHGISFQRKGRGRRYSPATIAAMTAELKAGARPTDVCARYGCTMELTKKLRRQFGDTFNRQELRIVKSEIRQAVKQALAAGQNPTQIERAFRFSHSWLWHFRKHILHDTEDLRFRPLVIPETERQQIAAELRAGGSIRAVARKFHHAYPEIKEIGLSAGWAPRKCRKFTPAERVLIVELMAAGKSNREIAQALQCSTVAIQQARLRSRWTKEGQAWKTTTAA